MRKALVDLLIELHLRGGDVQLSRGRTALVTGPNGVIGLDPQRGLFVYQTRVLSKYRWLMNGREPEFSCGSNIEQHSWMGYNIQAPKNWKKTPTHEASALQQTVELRLKRSVGEGMHEEVQLTNYTQISTSVRLELEFEPQFVAPEEAANKRKQHGNLSSHWCELKPGAWELDLDYVAKHHYEHQDNIGDAQFRRGLKLRIEHASSKPIYSEDRIRFNVRLGPHATWNCCLDWVALVEGQELPVPACCIRRVPTQFEKKQTKYLSDATSFKHTEDTDLRNVVLQTLKRARLDLSAIQMFDLEGEGEVTVAAGIPTYMGVFGRDLLGAAWQASLLGPELALGSLRILKRHQATEVNNWRDAEPGKIVHEMHSDPLSVLNFRPKSLYYGSVSGSFLYPLLVSELWHWTGELDLIRPFVEPAMQALKWADKYSLDETGFYRYQTKSEQGMKNQGWKDSGDAIV